MKGARDSQFASACLLGRIGDEFVDRCDVTGCDDLADGVAVRRDQIELVETCEDFLLVASEDGGHRGRLQRACVGHLGAAHGGERNGLVEGDHTGDGCRGELSDGVARDDSIVG